MKSKSSTKEKIKTEAFLLFAKNGFESTPMNRIAALVGVTKPAIYTWFASKEDLVMAILEDVENEYDRYMKQVMAETELIDGVEEKLYRLFEGYISYFTENIWVSAFYLRIIFFPPPALKERLAARMGDLEAGFFEKLKMILREGIDGRSIRPGSVDQMALSFYAMREGVLMLYAHKVGTPSVSEIWKDYWHGLKYSDLETSRNIETADGRNERG